MYTMQWLNNVLSLGMSPGEAFKSTTINLSYSGSFIYEDKVKSDYSAYYHYSSPTMIYSDNSSMAQNYLSSNLPDDLNGGDCCSFNDQITNLLINGAYIPVLYSDISEGFASLKNGCFVDDDPKNLWKYERLAFITRAGIVVLPGSGDGWSNSARDCGPSRVAGIKAGVISGDYIIVNGRILTIESSIHIQPSCAQLLAIGNISNKEFCDELTIGPSGWDASTLSGYGNYFVYDFGTPNIIWEGRGQAGDKNYGSRKLPYSPDFNFINYLGW